MTEFRVPEVPGSASGRPRKRKAQIHTEPVEVYCRIKPVALKEPSDLCCVLADDTTVRIYNPEELAKPTAKETHFSFTKVFDQSVAQQEVFNSTALRLVDDLVQGKNGLLFAYGVTSSGKTHTVTGTPDNPGILSRSIDVLFNSINNCQTPKYIFKPDHVNTFDIQSEAAALDEFRVKDSAPTLRPLKRDRNEWLSSNRVRETASVQPIENNLCAVFLSYIEVYNDFIFDLLDDQSFDSANYGRGPLTKQLKRSFDGSFFVSGLEEVEIKTAAEAFELLWKGQQRRRSAHTSLNDSSSRSHSVFNIRVVQAPRYAVEAAIAERRSSDPNTCPTFTKHSLWISQLSIVDLAGSERSQRTQNKGDRLREGCGINQSLMNLRMCMEKLRSNQLNGTSEMIPYNSSKLTTMFKNFFEGIGSVRMMICVNPSASEYRENLHVLKFAEMSQEVQVFHTDITAKAAAAFIPPPPPPKPVEMPPHAAAAHSNAIPPPLPRNRTEHGRGDADEVRENRHSKKKRSRSRSPTVRQTTYPVLPFPLTMDIPYPDSFDHEPDDMAIQLLHDSIASRRARVADLLGEIKPRFDNCSTLVSATYNEYYEAKRESADCKSAVDQRDAEVRAARDTVATLQAQLSQMARECRRLRESSNQERIMRQAAHASDSASTASSSSSASPMLPPFRTGTAAPRTATKPTAPAGRSVYAQAIVHQNPQVLSSAKKAASGTRVPPQPQNLLMSPSSFARTTSNPDVSVNQAADQTMRSRNAVPPKSRRVIAAEPMVNIGVSSQPASTAPIVAHLRHRRSKSAERWLEHDTNGIMKLDTVMQPTLSGKKRKSVTELTLADTKSADKYLLRTQSRDISSGDLKETLYKGDVVPTAGGGAAVILTEVEELHITSPGRSASTSHLAPNAGSNAAATTMSSTPVPVGRSSTQRNSFLSPAEVEERCAVGIIGRDGFKKTVHQHQTPMDTRI